MKSLDQVQRILQQRLDDTRKELLEHGRQEHPDGGPTCRLCCVLCGHKHELKGTAKDIQ